MGRIRVLRLAFTLFLGLQLHLIATLGGLPIGFALTGTKADERETLIGILAADPTLVTGRPGKP